MTSNNLVYVNNTFLDEHLVTKIDEFKKEDNLVSYHLNCHSIKLSMHADQQKGQYFIRQEIYEDMDTPGVSEFLIRQKVFQLSLNDNGLLQIDLYSLDSES